DQVQAWVEQGLTVVKIGVLLERQGVVVPYRTLHRFCAERCGYGRTAATTVRVAGGEPGAGGQLDFGYLGRLAGPGAGRRGEVHALILTGLSPTRPGSGRRRTSRRWSGPCSTCAGTSSPASTSPGCPMRRPEPRPGAGTSPGCGSTAPSPPGLRRCSPS